MTHELQSSSLCRGASDRACTGCQWSALIIEVVVVIMLAGLSSSSSSVVLVISMDLVMALVMVPIVPVLGDHAVRYTL